MWGTKKHKVNSERKAAGGLRGKSVTYCMMQRYLPLHSYSITDTQQREKLCPVVDKKQEKSVNKHEPYRGKDP